MGLHHDILNDRVDQLSFREPIVVEPTAPVHEVIALMQSQKLGCAVVVDPKGGVLGKFTERQLMKLLISHEDALQQPVGDHMTSASQCVQPTDVIVTLLQAMEEKKLRFVIVVDDQNKPIGITGQKGVMKYIADHFPRQVKVQLSNVKLSVGEREGA